MNRRVSGIPGSVLLGLHHLDYARLRAADGRRGILRRVELALQSGEVGLRSLGLIELEVDQDVVRDYPIADPIANTEAHADATDGVLELVLGPEGYDWRFVPVGGETFADSGSARCT